MERLNGLDAIAVKQKKEWGEILTGWETRNRYGVMTGQGMEICLAVEEPGMFLSRMFLSSWRPFNMSISSPDGTPILKLKRPFRWIFHEVSVSAASGETLGTVRREFDWFRRIYDVFDPNGMPLLKIVGPFFHPWTFNVFQGDHQIGRISKKWSGLGKEMFTDADNFGITFPPDLDVKAKALLLGALFLIDFVHFERSK